ncbi:MAG: class I SAM-dependent methyltransferase [Ardenticatenaceae bacterium]|nr:class I SAM-dependent methyltransferase [Ardenticatenaceae bacterium]MCB8986978.1 class I SAM-dependent methyltransferase [Ardenticatenaceae bacterium]
MTPETHKLSQALWRIYNRPERPVPWAYGGNLPWNDPEFSQRMLREHLDQSHGAASRRTPERLILLDWLWAALHLQSGDRILDATCGPGLYAVDLAKRGCYITGVDFGPASIAYARELAAVENVGDRCTFIEQDVRQFVPETGQYDAALFLYGQLSVFTPAETAALLQTIGRSLKPGGKLAVELLNPDRLDKKNSTWWFTDDQGLWGDAPFLHLGERIWYEEEQLVLERFQTLHLDTGEFEEIQLCDQAYEVEKMTAVMKQAGFTAVSPYPAWANLPLYDAQEWIVYIATK